MRNGVSAVDYRITRTGRRDNPYTPSVDVVLSSDMHEETWHVLEAKTGTLLVEEMRIKKEWKSTMIK